MAPEQKTIITLPTAFFLDTNILDALPESLESGELDSLLSEAAQNNCKVYLPDVVAREWIKHRLDKAFSSYEDIKKGTGHLRKYIKDIPDFKLDFTSIKDEVFKNRVQRIKNVGLRILRPSRINTRSITANAVYGVAPFTHSNKGFKDELIVLSMLDVVRKWTFKSCVLVTKDGDFEEKEIQLRFKPLNVEFRVATTLQQATKLIVDTLNEAGQKYYEDVLRSATKYAIFHHKEISAKIIQKVNSDGVNEFRLRYGGKYSALDGTLKRVIGVNRVEIKGAMPGIPDGSKSGLTPITISVDVELELEYEQMEFGLADYFGKKIKTIEDNREFRPTPYKRVTIAKTITASVEAKAKRVNEKWKDFEITEVSI